MTDLCCGCFFFFLLTAANKMVLRRHDRHVLKKSRAVRLPFQLVTVVVVYLVGLYCINKFNVGEESITNPIFIQQPAWPINGGEPSQ
jgi:hypothetical protein